MGRLLDFCEHNTAAGHCSECQHDHYTKTTILESPCPNCARLEDQLLKTEESSANEYQKVQRLQKQLEMCRSNLIKISVRCEGGMHKQDFDRIAELTSECLAKLEGEK